MESDFIPRTISRIRIAVYGPPKVGKTTFVETLLRVEPAEKTGDYTYEALREYKRITRMGVSESVEKYRLTLIDVPGGQEHKEKRLSALNKIVGWIFMYDVTAPESVEQLEKMIKEELEPNRKLKSALGIIIVGTKADMGINDEAKKKAEELIKYIEKITKVPLLYGYKIPHVIISNKDPEAVQQVYLCVESIVFDLKPSTVVLEKLKSLEEKYKSKEIKIPVEKPEIPEIVKPTPPQQPPIPQKPTPEKIEKPVVEIPKKEIELKKEIAQREEKTQGPEIPPVELPEIPSEMPLIEPLEDLDKLFTDTEETGLEGLEKLTPEHTPPPTPKEAPEIPEIPEIPKPEITPKATKEQETKEPISAPPVEPPKIELKTKETVTPPVKEKPIPPITEAEKKIISEKIDRLVEAAKTKKEIPPKPKEKPIMPEIQEITIKAASDKNIIELAMKLNEKLKDVTKIFLLAPQSKDLSSWSVAYDITSMVLGVDEEALLRTILNTMMTLAPINLKAFIVIGERKIITGIHHEKLLILEGDASSAKEWLVTTISANVASGLNFEKKRVWEKEISLALASDRELWAIVRRLKGIHPQVMNVYLVRKRGSSYEIVHDGARFLAKEQEDLISAIILGKDEMSKYLKDSIRFLIIRGSYSIVATFGIRGDSALIFVVDGDLPLDLVNFIFATAR